MADVRKTIEIVFQGDDQLTGTVGGMSSAFGQLESGVLAVAEPLSKLADGILAADATLAALAIGGLTYAFQKSKEFENSLIELKKVTDGSTESIEKAKKQAFELSSVYGESSSSILLSTADMIQAGYNLDDAMALTAKSMDLVIAGGLGASQASEILIATLKGFDAPASEAARLTDILNEVSQKYATRVDQLAIGMSKIAPISKLMGFSFEETAGLLTPVIEVFRSGDQAAFALRTGLLKLIDDAAPVKEALAKLGISQTDLNGKLRSGKDVLLDVAEAFKTAEQNDKLFLTAQLVGTEQSARMVTVFDNLAKYTDIVGVALNSAGSAAKEVALRLESAEVQVNRFKTGFENLGIAVGDQFKAAAVGAISGMTDIESAISTGVTSGAFEPLFKILREAGDELGKFLKDIAKALPEAFEKLDYSGILKGFESIRDVIGDLFGGLDLREPDDLAIALQKVVDTIEALLIVTRGMIEGFAPFFEAISQGIAEVRNMDDETAKAFGNILASAKLITDAGIAIAASMYAIQQSGVSIGAVFDAVIGSVTVVWNLLQASFSATVAKIVGVVEFFVSKFNTVFQVIPDVIANAIPGLSDFRDGLQETTTGLRNYQAAVQMDLTDDLGEAWEGAKRAASAFTDSTKEATEEAKDFGSAIKEIPAETKIKIDTDVSSAEDIKKELAVIEARAAQIKFKLSEGSLDVGFANRALDKLHDRSVELQDALNFKLNVDSVGIDKVESAINELPEEKMVEIWVDGKKIGEVSEELEKNFPDKFDSEVQLLIDKASLEETTKEVDKAVPEEKDLKVSAKLDKEQAERNLKELGIKADVLQASFDYKAKVDIAEIEAATAITQSAFTSLTETLAGSADILQAYSGAYSEADSASKRLFLQTQIREESARRDKELRLQEQLIEKQLEYYEARAEAAERGDALVQIDGTGLQPHLEAIMWEVLAAIQIRANEEGQAALLGLSV